MNDQKALNQKAITAFLNGALSEEDLQAVKGSVMEQMKLIGEQLKSLTAEEKILKALMEDAKQQVMNLAGTWQKAALNQRKELQSSVFPDGLRFSPEKLFFEPGNRSLISEVKSFVDKLVRGEWADEIKDSPYEAVQDGCGGLQPSERTLYSLPLYYPAEPHHAA